MGENLSLASKDSRLIQRASDVITKHGISGATFSIHRGLKESLVVGFNNDNVAKEGGLTAKEKSKIALNYLHYYLIEFPDIDIQTNTTIEER